MTRPDLFEEYVGLPSVPGNIADTAAATCRLRGTREVSRQPVLVVRGDGAQSVRMQPHDPEVLDCEPESTQVSLEWQHDGEALSGWVEVMNTGVRPCRLGGKPVITPLGQDGNPLEVTHIVSLEMRLPGFVVLRPGQRARASISWAGWDGPAAGRNVLVRLGPFETAVAASGPTQPQRVREPTNTSSTWFDLTT